MVEIPELPPALLAVAGGSSWLVWHPSCRIGHQMSIRTLGSHSYQYVPHKAVAEVSKIANYRRLVAVNHGSQSKSTDGSKSGWRQRSVVVVVIVVAM